MSSDPSNLVPKGGIYQTYGHTLHDLGDCCVGGPQKMSIAMVMEKACQIVFSVF